MATRNQRVKAILKDLESNPSRCNTDPSILQYTRVKKACASINLETAKEEAKANGGAIGDIASAVGAITSQGVTPPSSKKHRKSKKQHRKMRHKLTAEQKAKRKARLKKIFKTMLWLNPATQAIMVAKHLREKIQQARAKRKLKKSTEDLLDGIQNVASLEVASSLDNPQAIQDAKQAIQNGQGGDSLVGQLLQSVPQSNDTIETVTESAVEPSEAQMEDTGEEMAWAYAEGNVPSKITEAIALAKSKASKLEGSAKDEALSEIKALEASLNENYSTAKSVAKSANKGDIAEVSQAIKKSDALSVANSVTDAKVEKAEKKDNSEKKALGEVESSFFEEHKTKLYIGSGIVLASVGVYYAFFHKKA